MNPPISIATRGKRLRFAWSHDLTLVASHFFFPRNSITDRARKHHETLQQSGKHNQKIDRNTQLKKTTYVDSDEQFPEDDKNYKPIKVKLKPEYSKDSIMHYF